MYRQNKIKDIVFWVFLSLILSLLITLTVMLIVGNARLSRTEQHLLSANAVTTAKPASTEPPVEDAVSPVTRMYVLGEKDGKIAVFAADGYTVVDILDTYIYSLPVTDREAIRAGVSVYSVNELVSLIQDYTS